jgi:hypothetical protein
MGTADYCLTAFGSWAKKAGAMLQSHVEQHADESVVPDQPSPSFFLLLLEHYKMPLDLSQYTRRSMQLLHHYSEAKSELLAAAFPPSGYVHLEAQNPV